MGNFELIRFSSDEALAKAVAQQWSSELEGPAREQKPFGVALSGGRIARRFFSASAGLFKARSIPLGGLSFFWGDERCVPPNDAESNYAIARELLFEPLNIPETQIHRIRGEDPPEIAAIAAGREICQFAAPGPGGQPSLELIFLGIGEDGHVASLFPEEPEAARHDRAVYRAVTATKPPPRRITLGYAAVAAAKQVWVMASGAGKEKALRDSLAPGGRTPLAEVLKLRANTKIFTDIRIEEQSTGTSG